MSIYFGVRAKINNIDNQPHINCDQQKLVCWSKHDDLGCSQYWFNDELERWFWDNVHLMNDRTTGFFRFSLEDEKLVSYFLLRWAQ